MIIRCSGTADVVESVNFARDRGALLSIRGGGHNVAGNAMNDGGVVIDLSAMRGVPRRSREPDRARRRRRHLADVDREAQLFGATLDDIDIFQRYVD